MATGNSQTPWTSSYHAALLARLPGQLDGERRAAKQEAEQGQIMSR